VAPKSNRGKHHAKPAKTQGAHAGSPAPSGNGGGGNNGGGPDQGGAGAHGSDKGAAPALLDDLGARLPVKVDITTQKVP
jgi:hypothetical protein